MTASTINSKSVYTKMFNDSVDSGFAPASVEPDDWVRNPNWLALPTLADTDQRIVILTAVDQYSNYTAFTATVGGGSPQYQVDWGDGTVETFASGVNAEHIYDYSTYDTSNTTLVTHLGSTYKQAIISITPVSTNPLFSINFNVIHSAAKLQSGYSSNFLDIAISGSNIGSGVTLGAITPTMYHRRLEQVNIGNLGNGFNYPSAMFGSLSALRKVIINPLNTLVSSIAFCFYKCTQLVTAPLFPGVINSLQQAFDGCTNLRFVPNYNFSSSGVNLNQAFQNCNYLQYVKCLNGVTATDLNSTFNNCWDLREAPVMKTTAVTSIASLYNSCFSITRLPYYDFSNVGTASSAFNAVPIKSLPDYNFSKVTNASSMLSGCNNLETLNLSLPLATNIALIASACRNLTSVKLYCPVATTLASAFSGAIVLKSVDLTTSSLLTNISNIFSGCYLLSTFSFNTSGVTNFDGAFTNCRNMTVFPSLDYTAGTSFSNTFANTGLIKVPNINMPSALSILQMFMGSNQLLSIGTLTVSNNLNTFTETFSGCTKLESFGGFTNTAFPSLTTISNIFGTCYNLKSVKITTALSAATNIASIFNLCNSLVSVEVNNTAIQTGFTGNFTGCVSLSSIKMNIGQVAASLTACKLDRASLEDIMLNYVRRIATPVALTITNNVGNPTPISVATTGGVPGSLTVNCNNTTGITVGMQVTGTGSPLTTAQACTFQDSGDTVTIANHGYSDGDRVSFPTIVTTTGIITNNYYYVINSTTNTFQLASSVGGSVLPLTTDGTGTIRITSVVTAVVPNTSITLSRKLTSAATTLSFQLLKTEYAILKGWTITQ